MKALQVTAPGKCEIIEVRKPEPGLGQVLMKVEAVATCPQWDLHLKHNEPMFIGHSFKYPYTLGQPGHEATGEIAEVGPGVSSVAVGDRVSAWKDQGHHIHGCYAQYVVLQEENVIEVPRDLPPEAVASVELAMCVGTVFLMLKEMNGLAERVIGVNGLGPAGMVAAQMAKAEGAKEVIGFDLLPDRRKNALKIGVDRAFDPLDHPFAIRPGKLEIETAIDCVGAKKSVEFLMDLTEDIVALFGVQREDYTYTPLHYNGLRLCGYKGHSRRSAEYAVDLISKGLLDLTPLISHNLPLEEYNRGIELLEKRQATKICFWPWRD
jgi:threonine dehydrogenase-like Zn-dependent dehydrogenase